MEYNQNTNTMCSALTLFQQLASCNYDAIRKTEQICELPPAGRKALSAAKLSSIFINRVCNILNYLSAPSTKVKPDELESFEVNFMMQEIISRFENIVSTFNNVSVSLKSQIAEDSIITVSKTHFELIILNLLYCSVRTNPDNTPKAIKIGVSITENANYIVFHIHDDNTYPNQSDIQATLAAPADQFEEIDINSRINITTLSVRVAQKSAEDMDGRLAYTPLKTGNRYDIYLPKVVKTPAYTLSAPSWYLPTMDIFNEIFADLRLEHILSDGEESYKANLEGVMKL